MEQHAPTVARHGPFTANQAVRFIARNQGHSIRNFVTEGDGNGRWYVREEPQRGLKPLAPHEVTPVLIRVPRMFYDDHCERMAGETEPDGTEVPLPEPIRESERYVWLAHNDPGIEDLVNDAKHYASPDMAGGWDEGTARRLVPAAKRLLESLGDSAQQEAT